MTHEIPTSMLIDALHKHDAFNGWVFSDDPAYRDEQPNFCADIDDLLARWSERIVQNPDCVILNPANWEWAGADDIHYRGFRIGTVRGRPLTLYAQRFSSSAPVSWMVDDVEDWEPSESDDENECVRCHTHYPSEHFDNHGLCMDCFEAPPEAESDDE